MSGNEEKSSFWSMSSRVQVAETSVDNDSDMATAASSEEKLSSQYEMVQIAPVERCSCVFKSGQKMRVTGGVMLRHKTTGETLITGAVSNPGSNGRMTLAIDLKDVDKFSPM
jgi:hypothetical protein